MTTVQQQRKGVFRLMFVALAVFLLTLATRGEEAPEPTPEFPEQPPEEVRVEPHTWAPGERIQLPEATADARPEDCAHAWWIKDPAMSQAVFVREGDHVFLVDHRDVPASVLACFAGAVELEPNETLTVRF